MRTIKVRSFLGIRFLLWRGTHLSDKGGRKYGPDGNVLEKWTGEDVGGKRQKKEEASEVFKGYWRRCTSHKAYLKKEYQKMDSAAGKATS
jgi:hypothetical protein